jgi:hypothetical protein
MLILAECARSGFIVKEGNTWNLSPAAKDLPRFLALELKALQALGLERKTKTVPVLSQYIEAVAAKRNQDQDDHVPQPSQPIQEDPQC